MKVKIEIKFRAFGITFKTEQFAWAVKAKGFDVLQPIPNTDGVAPVLNKFGVKVWIF